MCTGIYVTNVNENTVARQDKLYIKETLCGIESWSVVYKATQIYIVANCYRKPRKTDDNRGSAYQEKYWMELYQLDGSEFVQIVVWSMLGMRG